jgi:carbon-monoxide dehydrogenase large subunit
MGVERTGAGRYVGQRIPRKEDGRLLTGRGAFVDDIVVAGMLHVAFVRSQIARGKVKSIDVSAARALPGVRAVLTAKDLGPYGEMTLSNFNMRYSGGPHTRPLSSDYVSYVGDPLALVVAETRYIAEDAAGMVFVDYEMEAPVVGMAAAKTGAVVHPNTESNLIGVDKTEDNPEFDKIMASAAHIVTGTIKHQRIVQSTMETRGVVSTPLGEELTVHIGCQSTHSAARIIAQGFNMPTSNVRVIAKDVGGGFGLKSQPWREEMATIAASLVLKRPLKWIEDRLEALTSSNAAREQDCTVRLAFDGEAKLLAMDVEYDANNGAYPHIPDMGTGVRIFYSGPYRFQNFRFVGRAWHTNTVGLGGYRGPWAMECLSREVTLDLAAKQIGIDPIELRRRNLLTKAEQPCMTASGMPLIDVTPLECLDELLRVFDLPAFRAEQAAARAEGRYLGIGICTYVEPTAAVGMDPLWSDFAHIRIEHSGKVVAMLSTHSQGHGTETTMAQVLAERLGVSIEDVTIHQDDSSRAGFGPGAAGSRQAVIGGAMVIKTADILIDKIKRIAAHVANANPENVTLEDGQVRIVGAEEMTRSIGEIAQIAYNEPFRLPPGMDLGLEAQMRYRPEAFMTHASAAHACIIEIDAVTGFVKIKRWICSEDCGVLINPGIVEGQIAGGIAQGIGLVLLEEMSFDEAGNPTAVTFKDYMLPTEADIPDFEYTHITTPANAPGGFRGVGEGGIIISAPTLVNAIMDALTPFNVSWDQIELPFTPSRIVKLMEGGPA